MFKFTIRGLLLLTLVVAQLRQTVLADMLTLAAPNGRARPTLQGWFGTEDVVAMRRPIGCCPAACVPAGPIVGHASTYRRFVIADLDRPVLSFAGLGDRRE